MLKNTNSFATITLTDGRRFEAELMGDGRYAVPVGLVLAGIPSDKRDEALGPLGLDKIADWDNGHYLFTPEFNCSVAVTAFAVGDDVRWSGWSDTHPGYVVNVSKSGKRVSVQAASAKLLNGLNSGEPDALVSIPGGFCHHVTGRQRYEFSPDPHGEIVTFTRRANGRFYQVGTPPNGNGHRLSAGIGKHHDYNF